MKKEKQVEQTNLQKCLVILIKDKLVIIGEGSFEGKKINGKAIFTATLVKDFPKPSLRK